MNIVVQSYFPSLLYWSGYLMYNICQYILSQSKKALSIYLDRSAIKGILNAFLRSTDASVEIFPLSKRSNYYLQKQTKHSYIFVHFYREILNMESPIRNSFLIATQMFKNVLYSLESYCTIDYNLLHNIIFFFNINCFFQIYHLDYFYYNYKLSLCRFSRNKFIECNME